MHFFGNTKLFCHFLLADIEKVLYIYMPFYDGMATFKGGNCSIKEDVLLSLNLQRNYLIIN